ncbi:hypothetical protein [Bowmanella denitrificans]
MAYKISIRDNPQASYDSWGKGAVELREPQCLEKNKYEVCIYILPIDENKYNLSLLIQNIESAELSEEMFLTLRFSLFEKVHIDFSNFTFDGEFFLNRELYHQLNK